jgi:hypothetical protein
MNSFTRSEVITETTIHIVTKVSEQYAPSIFRAGTRNVMNIYELSVYCIFEK